MLVQAFSRKFQISAAAFSVILYLLMARTLEGTLYYCPPPSQWYIRSLSKRNVMYLLADFREWEATQQDAVPSRRITCLALSRVQPLRVRAWDQRRLPLFSSTIIL